MDNVDGVRGDAAPVEDSRSGAEERRPSPERPRRTQGPQDRRVALFLDYENLRRGQEKRYHSSVEASAIGAKLYELARAEGRVVVSRAYGDWAQHGPASRDLHRQNLDPVLAIGSECGPGGATVRMSVDVVESLFHRGRAPDLYILASGDSELQAVVRRLREAGKEVVLACFREAAGRDLVRRADRTVWLDDLLLPREEPEGEIDFETYDWGPFARLLDSLSANLEFVGLNYLIRRVMDRANCGHADLRRKQDLINFAQTSGIIEVYQVANKDEGGDPVSACRLNKEHPIVGRLLEGMKARGQEGGTP
jgi:hypothetical protein